MILLNARLYSVFFYARIPYGFFVEIRDYFAGIRAFFVGIRAFIICFFLCSNTMIESLLEANHISGFRKAFQRNNNIETLQGYERGLFGMNADLNQRLDYELMMLEHKRMEYSLRFEQLRDCADVFLRRSRHGNSDYYYYIKRPGEKAFSYIGRSSHREVTRIRERHYLEEAINRLDHNIHLVRSLKDEYLPFDVNNINESLPNVYRCEVPPVSYMYKTISNEWLTKNLEFQKHFPENYPQNKGHRTSDGIMVKSISEALIYEKFKDAGLATIYELPFMPSDHGPALYPDFAVLSPIDMKSVIFVEFVGRMDLQQYREGFAKKVGRFIDSGYIPGVNLFFIFSDQNGNIDSLQIAKVIADISGLRDLSPSC